MEDTKIDSELKEIILQRILSSKLPKNIQLSIGNLTHAPMDIEEIAEHVKNPGINSGACLGFLSTSKYFIF